MDLTQELVDRYVGGQLEVQNRQEGYMLRGEIASVELTGEGDRRQLSINFEWFAKMGDDYTWQVDDPKPYVVSLLIYSVSDIGDDRIALQCPYNGELAVMFPPGGSCWRLPSTIAFCDHSSDPAAPS